MSAIHLTPLDPFARRHSEAVFHPPVTAGTAPLADGITRLRSLAGHLLRAVVSALSLAGLVLLAVLSADAAHHLSTVPRDHLPSKRPPQPATPESFPL